MRGLSWLLAIVLFTPVLAGCIGGPTGGDEIGAQGGLPPTPIDPASVKVPEGAELSTIPNGVALTWTGVELPFSVELEIPIGATVVRSMGTMEGGGPLFVRMSSVDLGSPRCEMPEMVAWNAGRDEGLVCTALTALDPMPATWRVSVGGGGLGPLDPVFSLVFGEPARAEAITVEYLSMTLDGIVGRLDLTPLSMPTHDSLETEVVKMESHDGTLLHLEITRPDTDEKVPAFVYSSPYNHLSRVLGGQAGLFYIREWAPRGYAVVVADVRGYGESDGCVEVWGPNEQLDQAAIVDWIARQEWSDGKAGFHGVSYDGTTPVEAAVNAPEALKAIAPVAGVVNAYEDWHHGGVPDGEDAGSPVAYQAIGSAALIQPMDPVGTAIHHGNGLCDPTLALRANDPNEVYDGFYQERNFSARAADVKAAVLFSQGFEDSNVKSKMALHWFNGLTGPKLGLFGHWAHQYAVRGDDKVLLLAWMDQYVRGRPLGFERVPAMSLTTNVGTYREGAEWPALDATHRLFYPDFASGALGAEPTDGSGEILLETTGASAVPGFFLPMGSPLPTSIELEGAVDESFVIAGQPKVHLYASLEGLENAYLLGEIYEIVDGQSRLVTYGGANLGLRNGYGTYEPVPRGEVVHMSMPFLPTEYVVGAGSSLVLVLATYEASYGGGQPGQPGVLTIEGGADGTVLSLPTLPLELYAPSPVTVGH